MGTLWPPRWHGTWHAEDGKSVSVERDGQQVLVTVRPSPRAAPYLSAELLGGGRRSVLRLPAVAEVDRGHLRLSVEAGTEDLGPRYHLRPAVGRADGTLTRPTGAEPPSDLVLVPEVTMGMYDDWDDDLGVPWAFPLAPLRWDPSTAVQEPT